MAKRLNNLLRGQYAALRAYPTPERSGRSFSYGNRTAYPLRVRLPSSVCLRRSLRRALPLDLLAKTVRWFYANWRKLWHALRQLSGDDAYERYLAHHTACHADTAPLSRKEFFRHEQQQKWGEIRRCC